MGFLLGAINVEEHQKNTMQPPFDIAADLDTPVSAYMKLASLQPRFLLESVEGGAYLARYSFLGFGDTFELRLDSNGLSYGDVQRPYPETQEELLDAMRDALARTPKLLPEVPDLPFAGGLVGIAGYDIVRCFERLPNAPMGDEDSDTPQAAYMATESLLVFDHQTRRVALLQAGSEK
jgi:anthranilate synthase component 1